MPNFYDNLSEEEIDRIETSIHEAAHATLAVHFGFPLTGIISISGVGGNAGSTPIGKPKGYDADNPANYFLYEQEIVINFAGAEAVKFWRKVNKISTIENLGDAGDVEQAKRCYSLLDDLFTTEETEEHCLARLRSLTADLVSFPMIFHAIGSLSETLTARITMPPQECQNMLERLLELD